MIYSIFATKDSWISSGSNRVTGITETDQNFGQDQILEIKKSFFNQAFEYPTRALIQFDLTELSSSIVDGEIPGNAITGLSRTKYYLRLFEAEGNTDLSGEYTIAAQAISSSWDEGVGKFGMNPKVTNGVSWDNRKNLPTMTALSWSNSGCDVVPGLEYKASQSFSYESPDINIDVTDIVRNWLGGTSNIPNHGFLLSFSGSQEQETGSLYTGELKFFSSNTHTIYAPRLEARWDDSSFVTGSLTELDVSGDTDNYVYPIGLKEKYKEDEKIKFRFGARKRYIQKTFSTSVQTISGSYIPEGSGSYSIVDCATGDIVIPFESNNNTSYTPISCDSTSPYFTQYLNTFHPDRVYKILLKLKYNDGQEQIFDDDFKFIVSR